MPRRGENIYKRKDGRWEGRYIRSRNENGQTKYGSIYGHSYSEVREKLEAAKIQQRKKGTQNCRLTVGELLDLWLEERELQVKRSSLACYVALVEHHICPQLGSLLLRELSQQKLEQYLSYLRRQGRANQKGGLSPKTIADILFVLKSAVKLAQRKYNYVDSARLTDVKAPAVPKRRIKTFGDCETARMSELLLKNWNLNHASLFLCLNTGIRLGELCGLRWSDIDIRENELHIRRTVQRIRTGTGTKLIVQMPKSISSERIIPLQPALVQMLMDLRGIAEAQDYFLSGKTTPMDPRSIQYRFQRFLKQNHLSIYNFHVLRHSFASRCIEKGVDAKCLSEILGHANVKTTLQLYVHPSKAQKRDSIQRASTLGQTA